MATCTRCGGSGKEPEREMTDAQWEAIDQFAELGRERMAVSAARTLAGTQAREQVYEKIRAATDRALALGVPKVVLAEALGVSRVQLNNILNREAS